jgi:nitrous oxide reductase accessory protein NosL
MIQRLLILLVLFSLSSFAESFNYDKNTTGLVRQLPVYKAPRWVAKIEVANGKQEYFCSPKSMFEFYHRPSKWFDVGVKKEEDFNKILVTDYKTFKPIDAKKAYYVYGSHITSPAGDDLVPFKLEADAKNFSKENNGKRILRFSEIKDTLIRLLNGRI